MVDVNKTGTFQEALVRTDERERVLEDIQTADDTSKLRSKALVALVISMTLAGTLLVPAWAAIIGVAVWVLKVLVYAPLPY